MLFNYSRGQQSELQYHLSAFPSRTAVRIKKKKKKNCKRYWWSYSMTPAQT